MLDSDQKNERSRELGDTTSLNFPLSISLSQLALSRVSIHFSE